MCKLVRNLDDKAKMQRDIEQLTTKLGQMKVELGLQRFAGSDKVIRFYTGFPDYCTLISFYNCLGPAVTQVNYWGSDCTEECLSEIKQHGPTRKLKPIDELFMELYRLRCNTLEKDIGD